MKIKYLVIDGNSLGYSCFFSKKTQNAEGLEIGALLNYLESMRSLLNKHPNVITVVLWDGKADWRTALYPDYKSRSRLDEKVRLSKLGYKLQRPLIQQALNALGILQISCPSIEADDLAYMLCNGLTENPYTEQIVLKTEDKDWWQLVTNSKVVCELISQPNRNNLSLCTFEQCTQTKNAAQYIESKCLKGDKTDSIRGVRGFAHNKFVSIAFVQKWGSVENYLRGIQQSEIPPEWEEEVQLAEKRLLNDEMIARFELNKKLIDLSLAPQPPIGEIEMIEGSWNEGAFFDLCKSQGLERILKKPDFYLRPFSNVASKHDIAKSLIYQITI